MTRDVGLFDCLSDCLGFFHICLLRPAMALGWARAGAGPARPAQGNIEGSLGLPGEGKPRQKFRGFVMKLSDATREQLENALRESVKLQSYYAALLNMHDGGERMLFVDADAWLSRLDLLKNES